MVGMEGVEPSILSALVSKTRVYPVPPHTHVEPPDRIELSLDSYRESVLTIITMAALDGAPRRDRTPSFSG